ncbi:hypothetical protein [Kurthia massiliensis]|uniref:hypothetical protein n=1 Tax=Kurthia massiliensis TaxID=1033739 RepID=UPI000288768D|nr:hypothetical protein [Kurthia massiliensis]
MDIQQLKKQLKEGRAICFSFQNANYCMKSCDTGYVLIEMIGDMNIERTHTSCTTSLLTEAEIMGLTLEKIFSNCHADVKQLTVQ